MVEYITPNLHWVESIPWLLMQSLLVILDTLDFLHLVPTACPQESGMVDKLHVQGNEITKLF